MYDLIRMRRSVILEQAGSVESAAAIVSAGTTFFNSDYLAGQYAFDAARQAGDGFAYESLVFHLECLAEAGAAFDSGNAVKIAQQFAAAHEFG